MVDDVHVDRHPLALGEQIGNADWRDGGRRRHPKIFQQPLMILNPLSVSVFQLRLTRSAIPAPVRLLVAMPLTGVPFLLVNANRREALEIHRRCGPAN
jgi:hypothetical protein